MKKQEQIQVIQISLEHQRMIQFLVDNNSLLKKQADVAFIKTMSCLAQFPEGEDISPGQKKYLEGLHKKVVNQLTWSRRST